MKYPITIEVPSTPEKEDYLLVVVIDDKYKTHASFAMARELKQSGQLKMIKSAIAKVKFLNDTKIEDLKKKAEAKKDKKAVKTLKKMSAGNDIVFMVKKKK